MTTDGAAQPTEPTSPLMPPAGAPLRYSRWDGTQQVAELSAESVLSALSDDLLAHGDLDHALRNLMQRGMSSPEGGEFKGLSDLVRQLREERRQRLEQYDLGGVMDNIQEQLEEVLRLERDGIADWNANRNADPSAPGTEQSADQSGDASAGANATDGAQGGTPSGDDDFSQQLLKQIAEQKQDFLRGLPQDAAGQVKALQDYEFLSPEAKQKFDELMSELRQAATDSLFKDMQDMVQNMSDGDLERMQQMMHALNDMLAQRIDGEEPDFDAFMQEFGDMFGPNPPQSLDELLEQMQQQMAAMQSLMASMSPEQREQLQSLFQNKFGDPGLELEMMRLSQRMQMLNPNPSAYPFRGDQPLDLQSAMRLMSEMQDIDELAKQMQRLQYGAGDLDSLDLERLRDLLGQDAVDQVDQMKQMRELLEQAGFIRDDGDGWELTPRGTRMIGENTLREIYAQLKNHSIGNHPVNRNGRIGDRTEDTKTYEFGDAFNLDMTRTLRNALERNGRGSPVKLHPDDFEVFRNELVTRTATVLLLDLSWSMARRGAFYAAKKVALAMQNLISSQYPRDSLYLVGFSAYARELQQHELPQLQWDEYMLGTNIQHALQIADRLLARHSGCTKQVIMITDGEPTSHMEHGVAQFAYPPTAQTIRETMKAVNHCTRRQITINTFMLDESEYLRDFVEGMTRVNGGRAFYTTPEQLGEYILVDYVAHKRKRLARG